MQITEANIGDILLLSTGRRIRIDSVSAHEFCSTSENGRRYVDDLAYIAAVKVTDPSAIAVFTENAALGRCLYAAYDSAMLKIKASHISSEEQADALLVYESAKKQLQYLESRLDQERKTLSKAGKPRLSDLISSAEGRAQGKPGSSRDIEPKVR